MRITKGPLVWVWAAFALDLAVAVTTTVAAHAAKATAVSTAASGDILECATTKSYDETIDPLYRSIISKDIRDREKNETAEMAAYKGKTDALEEKSRKQLKELQALTLKWISEVYGCFKSTAMIMDKYGDFVSGWQKEHPRSKNDVRRLVLPTTILPVSIAEFYGEQKKLDRIRSALSKTRAIERAQNGWTWYNMETKMWYVFQDLADRGRKLGLYYAPREAIDAWGKVFAKLHESKTLEASRGIWKGLGLTERNGVPGKFWVDLETEQLRAAVRAQMDGKNGRSGKRETNGDWDNWANKLIATAAGKNNKPLQKRQYSALLFGKFVELLRAAVNIDNFSKRKDKKKVMAAHMYPKIEPNTKTDPRYIALSQYGNNIAKAKAGEKLVDLPVSNFTEKLAGHATDDDKNKIITKMLRIALSFGIEEAVTPQNAIGFLPENDKAGSRKKVNDQFRKNQERLDQNAKDVAEANGGGK